MDPPAATAASMCGVCVRAWSRIISSLSAGKTSVEETATCRPWYVGRFAGIDDVVAHWRRAYPGRRAGAARFRDCFYDITLPPEVVEAVAANLAILKTPTVLRQADGRLRGFRSRCTIPASWALLRPAASWTARERISLAGKRDDTNSSYRPGGTRAFNSSDQRSRTTN
jgi:hypothetical protein